MSAPTRAVLVPPRPNLGPDPLPQSTTQAVTLAASAVALGLLVIGTFWIRRRINARRRLAVVLVPPPSPTVVEPDSSREWMIAWSDSVRETLVHRFGPSWRAKTTQEIALDERLPSVLGAEQTARLLTFLSEADHAKFAADGASAWILDEQSSESWKAWVAGFVAASNEAGPNGDRR